VYGKVINFQNIPFAEELFTAAQKMQINSLADESANFIAGHDLNADLIFPWYDLFVQKGSTVGLTLCSKSKVCVYKVKVTT
jgi:hypothetical protein